MSERMFSSSELFVNKPEAQKIANDTAWGVPFSDTLAYINERASHYPKEWLTRIQFGFLLKAAAITASTSLTDSSGNTAYAKREDVVATYKEAFETLGVSPKRSAKLVSLGIDYCLSTSEYPGKKSFVNFLDRVMAEKEENEKILAK